MLLEMAMPRVLGTAAWFLQSKLFCLLLLSISPASKKESAAIWMEEALRY